MSRSHSLHSKVIWPFVFFIAVGVSSYLVVQYQSSAAREVIADHIDEQQGVLITLAEQNAQNKLNDFAASIVQDCTVEQRVTFDSLLGRLDDGLSQVELQELTALFDVCASVYADRKHVMSQQISVEVAVLEQYFELHDAVQLLKSKSAFEELTLWQELASYEIDQATHAATLVDVQRQIIGLLIAGKTAADAEIVTILEGAAETKEAEIFAKTQAQTLLNQIKS